MKLIEEIRRDNIKILVEENGGTTNLGVIVGKDPSQISQWMNGSPDFKTGKPRGIRPEGCRLFEEKCDKEFGWMDHEHLHPENSQEDALLMAFRSLSPEMKIHLLRMAEASANNTSEQAPVLGRPKQEKPSLVKKKQ